MKPVLLETTLRATLKILLSISLIVVKGNFVYSQCLPGSNTANLNWDNMDYLVTTGNYAGFVTTAMMRTQAFMLGVNRVQINIPTLTTVGENAAHTGEAGSFGTGADVQYTGNGNIVLTFDAEVNNFQFSLYDIDNSQVVNVTATNAGGAPLLITMTRPATGNITITGSGTTNAQGQAPAIAQANTAVVGNLNMTIAGPVKTVTIALSGTAGDFWLSDFTACVTGTFPNNYFIASQPFTGQPTYVIGTSDTNTVSLINTTTGQAKMIFQDVTSPRYINGLGYDHIQHNLYYVVDFTATPATNKSIRRFDFDTETQITIVPNVNTLGIPTFSRGVESAGCAFYDGDLWFGVEGNLTPGNNGGRETIIWRIDFDFPGGTPIAACQAYATPSDNGAGVSMHDWNDFTIADGLLVDFAGSPTSAQRRYTHYDLQTQNIVQNYFTGGFTPRQAGITWNNTRYWVYDQIAVYNMNGTVGAFTPITGATILDWNGFCGDATGFRPKADFGDAPAIYDPVALSPALHEKDTALHLGPTWDQEFDKISSVNADADGADEDCISTVNVLDTGTTTYLVDFTIYNNTGGNVTVVAWLDWNGNNVFESTEGRSIVVASAGTTLQSRTLSWVGINTPLVIGQSTYLRIRVARTGLSVNTPTGYFSNGEVEDYRVYVTTLLPVNLLSFNANIIGEDVKLDWSAENEADLASYEIQRSQNTIDWETIGSVAATNLPGVQKYTAWDYEPLSGKSYYRLKILNKYGGLDKYSNVRTVQFVKVNTFTIEVTPNPVKDVLQVTINSTREVDANIKVIDAAGRIMMRSKGILVTGLNKLNFPEANKWAPGTFFLIVNIEDEAFTIKFSIVK